MQNRFPPAGRCLHLHRPAHGLLRLVLPAALGGCSGAPTLVFFGAYFPGWMPCVLAGIVAAVGLRALLVATGRATWLPAPLLLGVAVGLIVASTLWLAGPGR